MMGINAYSNPRRNTSAVYLCAGPCLLCVFVLIMWEDGFLDLKCREHDDVKVFAPVEGTECIAYSQNP